jgi:hypothetical protein
MEHPYIGKFKKFRRRNLLRYKDGKIRHYYRIALGFVGVEFIGIVACEFTGGETYAAVRVPRVQTSEKLEYGKNADKRMPVGLWKELIYGNPITLGAPE